MPDLRIAFIGAGAMGGRMACRLHDAGNDVVVWNRTPERAAALGIERAPTPARAAHGADAVLTMVADPGALAAVTEGDDGIAAGVGADATVIEMSTVGPHAVARLAEALPAETGLLDAPVLGSIGEAEAGSLRILVGGPAQLVERWTPLLSALGSPSHLGPLGAGAAAKLVVNSTLFGVLGVLGEAIALADALGLSRDAAFEAIETGPIAQQARRRRSMIDAGDYPPRFTLSLARKDAGLVLDAARGAGVDLRLAAAARAWLDDAQASGRGGRDYTAVLAQIIATAA
jgi:3-hydroxyisobutyrate dehydrogenase-like beta-hydroxyacid dehydrogenase